MVSEPQLLWWRQGAQSPLSPDDAVVETLVDLVSPNLVQRPWASFVSEVAWAPPLDLDPDDEACDAELPGQSPTAGSRRSRSSTPSLLSLEACDAELPGQSPTAGSRRSRSSTPSLLSLEASEDDTWSASSASKPGHARPRQEDAERRSAGGARSGAVTRAQRREPPPRPQSSPRPTLPRIGYSRASTKPVPEAPRIAKQRESRRETRASASVEPEVEPPPIPTYKSLRRNLYRACETLRVIEKIEPGAIRCGCEDECNTQCQNFLLNVECNLSICRFGVDSFGRCHNRFFRGLDSGLLDDSVEVFHTGLSKGFGLRATRPLLKGQLVVEYIGRVMPESKIRTWRYAMQLHSGLAIDASSEGGIGRFVNHSCGPNCSAERWTVAGEQRIGLFALKNIARHDEVTYCYSNAASSSRPYGVAQAPEVCHCGNDKCTGYIGMTALERGKFEARRAAEQLERIDGDDSSEASPGPVQLPRGPGRPASGSRSPGGATPKARRTDRKVVGAPAAATSRAARKPWPTPAGDEELLARWRAAFDLALSQPEQEEPKAPSKKKRKPGRKAPAPKAAASKLPRR